LLDIPPAGLLITLEETDTREDGTTTISLKIAPFFSIGSNRYVPESASQAIDFVPEIQDNNYTIINELVRGRLTLKDLYDFFKEPIAKYHTHLQGKHLKRIIRTLVLN